MSKKQNRASRRAHLQPQADERRDWLMKEERRRRLQTTPKQWKQLDPEPWYLPELGLEREPFTGLVPRYREGIIIRRAQLKEHVKEELL